MACALSVAPPVTCNDVLLLELPNIAHPGICTLTPLLAEMSVPAVPSV
jgi:hypothetical protein